MVNFKSNLYNYGSLEFKQLTDPGDATNAPLLSVQFRFHFHVVFGKNWFKLAFAPLWLSPIFLGNPGNQESKKLLFLILEESVYSIVIKSLFSRNCYS